MKDEPQTLDAQREKERRLALLALARGSTPPGPCLDAETLAALVEGRLPPAQLEACLGHLAGCDACAALWLQLDQEWRQSAKNNRSNLRQFLARPRVLAAAGSLLAAAASIAVFLNLTLQADRHDLMRLPEQSAREQVLSAPAPAPQSIDQAARTNATTGRTDGLAAPAQEPLPPSSATTMETMSQRAVPEKKAAGDSAARKQKKTEATPLAAPATKTAKPTEEAQDAAGGVRPTREKAPADSAEPAASAPEATLHTMSAPAAPMAEALPILEAWRQALRHDCQGQADRQQLAQLQAQGQSLLRQKKPPLAENDRRQLERLLALLAGPLPVEARCRAILAELGPAGGR